MVLRGTYPPSHEQCNWISFYVRRRRIDHILCKVNKKHEPCCLRNVLGYPIDSFRWKCGFPDGRDQVFNENFTFSIKIDFYYRTLATMPRFLWSYHWLVPSILCSSLKRKKWTVIKIVVDFWNVLWLLSLLLLNWASESLSVIFLHFNSLQYHHNKKN